MKEDLKKYIIEKSDGWADATIDDVLEWIDEFEE